ncbi:hypothetical protein BGZ57DRAFT_146403 [Hyaloscypha finlandica]|nr:hypothetical protein BGZ57DRAFT_146403 [Hyaloscypha finlandica]
MSSLNWDIGNECPIFCPLEARHPVILHCIQSQEKLLILRATALAAAHLSSFFFPTHQLLPQALNLSRKCRNLEVQVHRQSYLHLQSPHAPPGCFQAVSHSKPHLRTHCIANTPHSPLTLPISAKKEFKKFHLPHNSPPKSLDHPQKKSLARKQPHDPANAKPPTQRRKVNSNPRPPRSKRKSKEIERRVPFIYPTTKNEPMTQGDRHTLATPLPIRSSLLRHPTRPIELLTPD